MFAFFDDVKQMIGFTDAEAAALRDLLPIAEPHLERLTEEFCSQVASHPGAAAALRDPSRIAALREPLGKWLLSGLRGPYDEVFLRTRWRIGQRHVGLGIPQHFMLTSLNLIRIGYHRLIELALRDDFEQRCRLHAAMDKLLDLELAIILQSYLEDSKERMARRERLASIGRLAGNVAHELRNPLGVIESSAYLMRKQRVLDDHGTKHLDRISDHVARCSAIVHNLLELARNREPQREKIRLASLLDSTVHTLNLPDSITVERDIPDGLEIIADGALLSHAISNLIVNAVAAYDGNGGRVRLAARADQDGRAVIEVSDDGPGFDDDILANAFEPLVTKRGGGIGLGLALVRSIVQLHGGRVEAANDDGGGARIRLLIPLSFEEAR